jgi:hypothetical protein
MSTPNREYQEQWAGEPGSSPSRHAAAANLQRLSELECNHCYASLMGWNERCPYTKGGNPMSSADSTMDHNTIRHDIKFLYGPDKDSRFFKFVNE